VAEHSADLLRRLVNGYATVNFDDGATNDDSPNLILIVVVGNALIHVSPASVFLSLARWQPRVTPTRLLPVAPSSGSLVAISVDAILVSVAAIPAPVIVPIVVFVSVLVLVPVSVSCLPPQESEKPVLRKSSAS
jgi:hypothetical protein